MQCPARASRNYISRNYFELPISLSLSHLYDYRDREKRPSNIINKKLDVDKLKSSFFKIIPHTFFSHFWLLGIGLCRICRISSVKVVPSFIIWYFRIIYSAFHLCNFLVSFRSYSILAEDEFEEDEEEYWLLPRAHPPAREWSQRNNIRMAPVYFIF